jgi:Flp pilus assembly protein TadB
MKGIFKFILFLLSFVGLGVAASSKRKKEVKKIDKEIKDNKKEVKESKKKVTKSIKEKKQSVAKKDTQKKQIKKRFTEENADEAAKFLKDFASK